MTAPANDNFADAIVLSGSLPITRTGDTNLDATTEVDEPLEINYGEIHPEDEWPGLTATTWYAWNCGTTDTYAFRIDTSVGAILTVYTGGTTFADLERAAQSEMDYNSPYYEIAYFEGTASQTYYFQVGTYDDEYGDIDLELDTFVRPANDAFADAATLTSGVPVSSSNAGATREAGEPSIADYGDYYFTTKSVWYKWTAAANGYAEIAFTPTGRWVTEGAPLLGIFSGTAVASLTDIVAPQYESYEAAFPVAAGTVYYVQISAAYGWGIEEGDFDLELTYLPPFFPDSSTITLSGGSASVSDTTAATTTGEQVTFSTFGYSGTITSSAWWDWTPDADGVAVFDTFTSTPNTTAAVYTGGTAEGLTCLAFNDDYAGGTATIPQSEISWAATEGETYYLQVGGTAAGTVAAHLYFDPYVTGGSGDPSWDSGTADAYRIELRELNSSGFDVTTSSLELVSFAINWRLNGPGAFDGTGVIGTTQADAANVGARELIVYKGDTAIWGGYLTFFDVDEDSRQVRVGAEGYWSRSRSRLMRGNQIYKPVTNSGVAWKADQIAWDIIDQAQGATYGDMGWVYGGHSGTRKDCKRVYYGVDRTNVGEAIEALAREGYFDFSVDVRGTPVADNVAQFRTWLKRGSDLSGSVNLSSSNAMTLNYSLSSSDMATVIDVFGSVEGCRGVAATETVNLATYGRLEARPIDMETDEQAEVDETAAEFIDQHSVPAKNATVTYLEGVGPDLTDYDLGDTIRVSPGDGYVSSFDGRVVGRELAVEAGRAVITVEVER